jgi:hypothetical protein
LMEILTNTMKGNCVGKFFFDDIRKIKEIELASLHESRIASRVVIIR